MARSQGRLGAPPPEEPPPLLLSPPPVAVTVSLAGALVAAVVDGLRGGVRDCRPTA
jgi:hypothetical protein